MLNPDIPFFANSVDPDQLASEEANWSGSALLAIQYLKLYQQSGSSNLICVEVLQLSQPNGVMSSVVSLPNHTFTGQAVL